MKFSGKKLLVLGSNAGSTDIVQYAKENGAVVYVAGNLEPEKSPAKRAADIALQISTADIDTLERVMIDEKIDAVVSGISGFNILKAMELSERLGLTFYCNKDQWEMIEHKDNFREVCKKYNVPCPQTYYSGLDKNEIPWETIRYPAVLKPVDAGASSGVHICSSKEEICQNLDDAFHSSDRGAIIIEEFISGNEFTAHYTIFRGKATLSCIDNRYPVAVHEGSVTTIPAARVYPSTFTESYIKKVNDHMLKLAEGIGIYNGVIFIQGIHDPETDEFKVFEAGCRSAAETPCRLLEKVTGNNYLKMIVDTALNANTSYDPDREDPFLKGKCCGIISFVAKGGTVGCINHLEESIASTPSVVAYESRYPVGSVTPDGDTLHQLMIRFVMVCDSREAMEKDIAYLNESITVLNTDDENMVIKFDPQRLEYEF